MHDAMQFIRVEPGAMRAADIQDDTGTVGEVQAMHELVALRAANVALRVY